MICKNCLENTLSKARYALGFKTCLICGEKEARKEVERRRKCITIPYNKGPYMYAGSTDQIDKK
jgi:hypothetical protein